MSQLKRTGNKVLLKGGALEDAIAAAITAMNEPKTCSTTILRRYLLDANKDRKQYQLGKRQQAGAHLYLCPPALQPPHPLDGAETQAERPVCLWVLGLVGWWFRAGEECVFRWRRPVFTEWNW